MIKLFDKIDKLFWGFVRLGGYFLGVWGITELLSYFKKEPFKDNFLAFILFSVLCWVISEFYIYVKDNRREKLSVSEAMIQEVSILLDNKQYDAVLRRRKEFSRSLFVEGRPHDRIRIGLLAENAAIEVNNKVDQASILIDDLGWTNVTIKEYESAEKYILHGLRVAKEIPSYFLQAKGYRHLAGLYAECNDSKSTKKYLKRAEEISKKIHSEQEKLMMLGGIYYGWSVFLHSLGENDKALSYANKSEKMRLEVGDKSRIVKIYSLKGKIAESLENLMLAKDCYRTGLSEARKIGRKDEEIRNLMGLARIFHLENNKQESREFLKEANELLHETPIPYMIDFDSIKLRKINTDG